MIFFFVFLRTAFIFIQAFFTMHCMTLDNTISINSLKRNNYPQNISYFFFSFLITMLISLSIHLHCPIAVILLQNSIKSKDIICISNHIVETHLYFSFSFPSSFPIILLLFLFINCPTHRDESNECISASFNAAFQ